MIVDTDAQPPRQADYYEIETWLLDRFAKLADIAPDDIDVDRPFADYQLDSSVAVTLTQDLSRWLARELSITLFWEYPSIRDLSSALADERATQPAYQGSSE